MQIQDFKKLIRDKGHLIEEIVQLSGLSRQGFDYAFNHDSLKYESKAVIAKFLGETIESIFGTPTINLAKEAQSTYVVRQIFDEDFMEVRVLNIYSFPAYLRSKSSMSYELTLPVIKVFREYKVGHYLVIEVPDDSMNDKSDRGLQEEDKVLMYEIEKTLWTRKLPHALYCIIDSDKICIRELLEHDVKNKRLRLSAWNSPDMETSIKLNDVMKIFEVKKLVERKIKL